MAAAMASAEAQKEYWQESVDECMLRLNEAGVEVIIPDKSLFASRTTSIIDNMKNEPHLASYISRIENSAK